MKGPIQILVLGKEGVGKTALVVRFLTRRYLTEFAQLEEVTYERPVYVDDRQVTLRITDVSGKILERRSSSKEIFSKVDAVVVVYSITDRQSYDVAENIVDWLKRDRKSNPSLPVLVLGNKCDMDHLRVLSRSLNNFDSEYQGVVFLSTECSACEDSDGVVDAFHSLIRKVIEKREGSTKSQRKLSHVPLGSPKQIRATIKRRFSVFSRERTTL
ncbi:ras-related and estrogen-regulated growth inhibitor-like [Haliotis rubra]|uniref:ras-related and estrogen-regulated growth inhibitor-like n=1 Tax=Haliotis rubra TaxID=36100 RepID=UPI001EE53F0B|nr:ras-related and estrogen-regulated growth inhibitor-like [Haliotis rubra]